jgi:hypothetical protein
MFSDLETELKYVWLMRNVVYFTKPEITTYLEEFHTELGSSLLSTIMQDCKYLNESIFVTFFILMHKFYPEETLHELQYFSWYNYIDTIAELLESRANDMLCKKIIQIITEQLYEERYNDRTVTSLCTVLPRERKSLDRRTHIVKTIAYNYYQLYIAKNEFNEWEDIIGVDGFKRSNALKLYRKDCAYLQLLYKKQA